MSLEISLNKKKDLYENYLSKIGDIKFTFREIDVIACVMHNRGEKRLRRCYKYLLGQLGHTYIT